MTPIVIPVSVLRGMKEEKKRDAGQSLRISRVATATARECRNVCHEGGRERDIERRRRMRDGGLCVSERDVGERVREETGLKGLQQASKSECVSNSSNSKD